MNEYYLELKETVEKLNKLLENDKSDAEEHPSREWMDRKAAWYELWLAVQRFRREEL
jgi:hypothetical protein